MHTETFKRQQGSPCKILIHNVVQRQILTDSKNEEQASVLNAFETFDRQIDQLNKAFTLLRNSILCLFSPRQAEPKQAE